MNTLLRMYPGDGWAVLIANVLVQVTVVILMAWLLARLGSRWNAAWRHTVFFVALLCVLASPLLSWLMQARGIALVTLRRPAPTTRSVAPAQIRIVNVPDSHLVQTPAVQLVTVRPVDLEAKSLGHSLPPESRPAISTSDILRACGGAVLLIWLLGMAFHLSRWCHGLYLLAAFRRGGRPLDCEPMADTLRQVRQALGVDRLPALATSVALDRPIMVGLLRRS